jgi:hypothetical protein
METTSDKSLRTKNENSCVDSFQNYKWVLYYVTTHKKDVVVWNKIFKGKDLPPYHVGRVQEA